MLTFDPTSKRIILDTASTSATEIFSRWEDWALQDDNVKYGVVIKQVGSEDLGSGLSIPPYFFLQNGWRVRPMEADHVLTISGNLFTDDGSTPVVRTLGPYQVNVVLVVPVQAQGIATGGTALPATFPLSVEDKTDIATKVWTRPKADYADTATMGGFLARQVMTVKTFLGLS